MIKLFKKKEIQKVQEVEELQKTEQEIIQEIHDAFESAQDRLLREANYLIETASTKIVEKANRLKEIGFVNSKLVKANEENKTILQMSKEQADLINYYKMTYPFQKFLTEDELDKICDKYGLIYAPISNYIEDVPEKNIKDIENISLLKEKDILKRQYKLIGKSDKFETFLNSINKKNNIFEEGEDDILISKYSEYDKNLWGIADTTWLFVIWEKTGKNGFYDFGKVETIDKSELFIAAPKSHFNLEGLDRNKEKGWFKTTTVEVKDPIVFRYVKGGIQVITKWGLEAEDPMLLNEIEN